MENRAVTGAKGSNLSGLKTMDPDKKSEKNVLEFLNKEISVSDPTHARKAQNKELDLIVTNLLEQAITESDKRQGHSGSEAESGNKPSGQSKSTAVKKEASKSEAEPNYDLEFGVAAGSTDASHSETQTEQPQVSESVKMDSTPHEAPINSDKPPVDEHGVSGVESAVTDINNSELVSEMEPIDSLNDKGSGKISLNKYALAGIIATIVILIGLAAYFKYEGSGSDENLDLMGSIAQGQNTVVQSDNPILSQDQLEDISATLTTVLNQGENTPEATSPSNALDNTEKTVLEQSSVTLEQTPANKGAEIAKTNPKVPSKQNKGPEQDGSSNLTTKKAGKVEKAVAATTTKDLPSPGEAGAGKTDSRVEKIENNRNIQKEEALPVKQSAATADKGANVVETDSNANRVAVSEPINNTISSDEIGDDTLALPIGTEPTWDSIAALVPEDVVTNIGNTNREIKSESFSTNTPDVVKSEYKPPVLISKVNPSYPRMAAQIRETGIVTLKLDINKQGRVIKAEPINGPIVFHEEAMNAVLQWKYRPASRNGRNADSQITISINFNIK